MEAEHAMNRMMIALAAAAGVGGCAASGVEPAPGQPAAPAAPADMACKADAARYHVGHDATQAMGAAILRDSGARTLRWGPPNSAWTMDYREDRVNVRYDDKMKITDITCG